MKTPAVLIYGAGEAIMAFSALGILIIAALWVAENRAHYRGLLRRMAMEADLKRVADRQHACSLIP